LTRNDLLLPLVIRFHASLHSTEPGGRGSMAVPVRLCLSDTDRRCGCAGVFRRRPAPEDYQPAGASLHRSSAADRPLISKTPPRSSRRCGSGEGGGSLSLEGGGGRGCFERFRSIQPTIEYEFACTRRHGWCLRCLYLTPLAAASSAADVRRWCPSSCRPERRACWLTLIAFRGLAAEDGTRDTAAGRTGD